MGAGSRSGGRASFEDRSRPPRPHTGSPRTEPTTAERQGDQTCVGRRPAAGRAGTTSASWSSTHAGDTPRAPPLPRCRSAHRDSPAIVELRTRYAGPTGRPNTCCDVHADCLDRYKVVLLGPWTAHTSTCLKSVLLHMDSESVMSASWDVAEEACQDSSVCECGSGRLYRDTTRSTAMTPTIGRDGSQSVSMPIALQSGSSLGRPKRRPPKRASKFRR